MAGGTKLSRQRKTSRGANRNRLRIIGGRWRGRKLDFPEVEGLRPTPDRVRETLFNWLQNDIVGARCLDLFTGSGALGLEALSRGAARAVLVENSKLVAQQLDVHLRTLQCSDGIVVNMDAQTFLERGPGDARYNIVFLDPPFEKGLVENCIQLLEEKHWLADDARIYLETEHDLQTPALPGDWKYTHERNAGQVNYYLARNS